MKESQLDFMALGCPKNVVDSERMLAEIAQANMLISEEPENADVVIINTCAFIEPAKKESTRSDTESYQLEKGPAEKCKKNTCRRLPLGKNGPEVIR